MSGSDTDHIKKRFKEIYGEINSSDSIKQSMRDAFFAGYRACQKDVMKIYLEDI